MQLTMKEIQQQLEWAINRTPSGEKRNAICDANIALAQAIRLDEQVDGGVPVGRRAPMRLLVQIELTKPEMATICSNSIERVLNNAIEVGGETESCKAVETGVRERASTLWQDCEELKPITTKLWSAVSNEIFKNKGV